MDETSQSRPTLQHSQTNPSNPYEPLDDNSTPEPRRHELTNRLLGTHGGSDDMPSATIRRRSVSGRRKSISNAQGYTMGEQSLTAQLHEEASKPAAAPKLGLVPRPVGGDEKLGMISGVFVPTSLNVLSILMFLRFGFILGQGGVVGIMGMLIVSYIINLLTTLSLSAIASNGTVRGGGAYYLISRSLGPEFGGSIGVVFYLGFVFNTGMNAVGLIDCFNQNFGAVSGTWSHILPEDQWWSYLWSTVVLVLCTLICLGGSGLFARASNGLLLILMVATLSIPLSAIIQRPFESRSLGIEFTGLSLKTFKENLMPQLTRGAAGSQMKSRETFQDLFGILFPATGGIFAGASMSGDLKNPSKSIPVGTLYGLAMTFITYTLVILAMAATITRASFVRDVNVIQDTNMSGMLVLAGEFASTFFSTLMGVIGSAKLLQALARDNLLPGISIFGQGTKRTDDPVYAIIFTYIVAQFTMLLDINQIASFTTMTYLMTFLVMNLACFLLKISAAPNFRPSFHFFNWQTAFVGTIVSGAAMFFVDGIYATACVGILVFIFLVIHYTTPPKSWGDVSQSLIYHQCRKYLLRLKQEHVKFWRPQILLFVNDPRRQYKLIQFCNSMKKGALYILGHVIVTQDFGSAVPEARKQQAAWTKYIDFSKIKAFVNIAISPAVEWGARNIVLSAGLGGMRPNIAVMGFYNLQDLTQNKPLIDIDAPEGSATKTNDTTKSTKDGKYRKIEGLLPTDDCRREDMMSVMSYVTILEDLLLRVQINVAVARGFQALEFPNPRGENRKKYIDLWPIQMSAEIETEGENKPNVLTTNFDTYTLILQLGCILNTVPDWKKVYTLRVAVFVEYESDVDEERGRVQSLLENLRIEAEVLVFWLASGDLKTYEVIVNGASPDKESEKKVEDCLRDEEWWDELQIMRGKREGVPTTAAEDLADVAGLLSKTTWPETAFQQGPRVERVERFLGLKKLLRKSRRRHTMSGLTRLGVSLGMRTHRLAPQLINRHVSTGSASEDSDSSSDIDSDEEVFQDDEDDESGRESAASEGDLDDYETDSPPKPPSPIKIMRRRSHGDSLRGPPPSKKSTGEREPKVPEPSSRKPSVANSITSRILPLSPRLNPEILDQLTKSLQQGSQPSSLSDIKASLLAQGAASSRPPSIIERQSNAGSKPASISDIVASSHLKSPRLTAIDSKNKQLNSRPSLSRHASTPKFSSKPVPLTKVSTEDGPGPSIMFSETPSPPEERARKTRLPSAYRSSRDHDRVGSGKGMVLPDHISEVEETGADQSDSDLTHSYPFPSDPTTNTSTSHAPNGTTTSTPSPLSHPNPPLNNRTTSFTSLRSTRSYPSYTTSHLALTFNDLPRRAQHLILNELMASQSEKTAVLFTTLPSPVEGTCKEEEECLRYLGDLDVLGRVEMRGETVPVLLVHSNSMTVTMNL